MDNERAQWAARMLALLEPLKSRLTPDAGRQRLCPGRNRRPLRDRDHPDGGIQPPAVGAGAVLGGRRS